MRDIHEAMWHMYQENKRQYAFEQGTDWPRWQEGLKTSFIQRLGMSEEDWQYAHRVPSHIQELERTPCDGYTRERVSWTSLYGMEMPVYVLTPDHATADTPVVVALHGHGYGSREIVGIKPDGTERDDDPGLHKDFAIELVKKGFVVAAPELIGFGDRRLEEDKAIKPQQSSCLRLSLHLMMHGKTIGGLRVIETMQTLTYLRNRMGTRVSRAGIMGISGGGLIAGFTAAIDERFDAAVISGYANTFADSILDRPHCLDNYIPGVLQDAEMPELLGLIAPRPMLIESGDTDLVFPREGAKRAYAQLGEIYTAAGAPQHVEADFFTGGHEIGGERAYDWLRDQLLQA